MGLSVCLTCVQANANQDSNVLVQVLNRDRLQRAGEDNLFVRLLYAKDKPQIPKTLDEQEKLGICPLCSTDLLALPFTPLLHPS